MTSKKKDTAATAKTTKAAAKTTVKAAADKQTEEKKTAAKKPACKTSVCVEMVDLSVSITDIQNAVKKAVKDKGLEASDLKIYINAAEQAAYYTVNGEGGEDFKVTLRDL